MQRDGLAEQRLVVIRILFEGRLKALQRLVRSAKEAGADAIKLQTYTADTLTIRSDRPKFRVGGGTLWDGRTLYDLYCEAYTPWEWQPRLKLLADQIGIDLFSTPFDPSAVDFLEEMNVPAYKVASFELVDLALIEQIARTGKPMIINANASERAQELGQPPALKGEPMRSGMFAPMIARVLYTCSIWSGCANRPPIPTATRRRARKPMPPMAGKAGRCSNASAAGSSGRGNSN